MVSLFWKNICLKICKMDYSVLLENQIKNNYLRVRKGVQF